MATSPLSAAFLDPLWGARPAALGGAFTALADDANAPAYNPAGISWIADSEVTFTYARLFTGADLQAGGADTNLALGYASLIPSIREKKYGSYGLSWHSFAASDLYREDAVVLTAADAFRFDGDDRRPILGYGLNLKWMRRGYTLDERTRGDRVFADGRSRSAFGLDVGLLYRPHLSVLPGLAVGFAGRNVNEPDMGFDETERVPVELALGLAYQDPRYRMLNPTLEVRRRDGRTTAAFGWESWFANDAFALRAGGSRDQVGVGLGTQLRLGRRAAVRLDYALLWPLEIDGTDGSHRVSLSSRF